MTDSNKRYASLVNLREGTIAREIFSSREIFDEELDKLTTEGPEPGNVALQVSEENPRQFYRRWRDYMQGADWDTLMGLKDTGPASFAARGRWPRAPSASRPTPALFARIVDVNLGGTYRLCRAVLPTMIAQGGGAIVNVGSGAGHGKPNMAIYAASKGAIAALSAAMAYDHFHQHVRVNVVIPGGGHIVSGMSVGRAGDDPRARRVRRVRSITTDSRLPGAPMSPATATDAPAAARGPSANTAPMPAPRPPRDARYFALRAEIEELIYDEAELLDERRFEAWIDTLAEDLEYFMPMESNVNFGEHAAREHTTRARQMSWFNEGKWTLGKRVDQILTGVHWAEEPLSRVCRMVSNVRLTSIDAHTDGTLEVGVNSRFLIYQNRCEYEQYFFVGDRIDVIRRTADGWKLAKREIRIHQNVLLAKNLPIFF